MEAGRLRRRLVEYYADEGAGNPVRIHLPRGSYSIVSAYSEPQASDPTQSATNSRPPADHERLRPHAAAKKRRRWRRIRSVVVVAALSAGAAVILFQQREATTVQRVTATPIPGSPPIVVLPFEMLGGSAGASELAAALTEEIFLVLGGPEALVVPAVPSATSAAPRGYVLSGSVRELDGQVRITARIVRADAGTQVWSAAYDEPAGALRSAAGQRRIARLVAMAAEPYGPIFEAEVERMRTLAVGEPTTRDCLLRYYEYRSSFKAAEHAAALKCFELATKRQPDSVEAWAGLSLLASDSWAHGFADLAGSAATLDLARESARKAMDIDGQNLHANLALVAAQYFSGAEFRDVADRALKTWPEHAELTGYLGGLLILSGDTARGDALVAEAIEWTTKVPSGYYATRSLAALREQRFDEALALALRIDAPDWALGHFIVATAGALGGRSDLASRAYERLVERDGVSESSLAHALQRWRVEPVLAEQIERGMAAAAAAKR